MNNKSITIHYVCAICWGELVEKCIDGEWVVCCAHYPDHEGRVTRNYAESQRKLSRLEAAEVGAQLADILHLPKTNIESARHALYGDDKGL